MKYQKNKIKEKDSINLLVKLLEGTCEILKKHPRNLNLFIIKLPVKVEQQRAMKILKEKKTIFNKFNIALKNAKKKSILLSKKF